MKMKISIALSEELLHAIDKYSRRFRSRSEFIEAAIRTYIANIVRREQNSRDLAIINQEADCLNKEAADVLSYQIVP